MNSAIHLFPSVAPQVNLLSVRSIEFYSDYRSFLKDYQAWKKSKAPTWSYRVFCRKGGITNPSLFLEVAEGRRNLTEATMPKFAKGLDLSEADTKFFVALVQYNQAKTMTAKQQYFESLRGLRRRNSTLVPLEHHEYYSQWYFPVLRELATLQPWGDDHAALGKATRPALSVMQVKSGLDLLQKLGMLQRQGDRYLQTEPHLSSGSEVDSLLVRSCNRQFLELGIQALEDVPPPKRDVSSMVLGISERGFHRIKEEIAAFRGRLARLAEEDESSDRVYSLAIQFLPHSKVSV